MNTTRKKNLRLASGALWALLLSALPGTAAAQFNCLPSCDPTDARFLVIVNGAGFRTLSDPTLDLTFIVPAGTPSFEIGIFDGDAQSGTLPDLHWDTGNPGLGGSPVPVFEYTVFADPGANVSGTQVVAGPFIGTSFLNPANQMPDNDWFDIPITTGPEAQVSSGDYFYRLRIELVSPAGTLTANSFKVRTSEIAVLEPIAQPFGYVAQRSSAADEAIIYPSGFPGPTTYDGLFSFFVESATAQTTLSVWDGDFDRGDFNGANSDTDDPNTPGTPFEPTWATTDTNPEGIATGTGVSTGSPPDDKASNPATDQFLRQPSVRYDLIAPDSQVFPNENPSGNQEWEEFKISTIASDPTADVLTTSLPAGSYELRIEGVDMSNFNFLLTPSRILCADENGLSCPPPSGRPQYQVGDTVFEDSSGDGVQQAGEPGIAGVIVNLLSTDGNVLDTTVTDAGGNYSFTVSPATYTVEVASENFGAPAPGATLGDRVWLDDGDGLDSGEPGIASVILHLYLDGGDGLSDGVDDTFVAATDTGRNGFYLFTDLAPGTYWVDVVDFTVPAGLSLVTAGGASDPSVLTTLAAGGVDLDVDFPYSASDPGTAVVGNLLWIDADGNGLQDAGEAGISNVTVVLKNSVSGVTVAERRTGSDGRYLFTGVAPGTYVVDVTDTAAILSGAGLTPTVTGAGAPHEDSDPDPTAPFAVVAGDVILDKDFGYVNMALADVHDVVWFDANRNGLLDGSETGLAGVTVKLVDTQGGAVAATTTAADGSFTFADLPDGSYGLEITDLGGVLTGLLPTTTASARGSQNLVVAGADVFGAHFGWVDTGALEDTVGTTVKDPIGDVDRQVDTVVDAGVVTYDFGYRGFGSLGDRVWLDENGDGVQDGGEVGIDGVTVTLLDGSGAVITTTTTAGDGHYAFADLAPGLYTVVVDTSTLPAGLAQTFDLDGLATANATMVALAAGEDRVDVDFGYGECGPCQGKVSRLTLAYIGSLMDAQVQVFGKRGPRVDELFNGVLQPGDELDLEGPATGNPGFRGTLGTEVRIYVNGALHTTIHTSCSVAIGPGLVSGDFEVAAGASRNGGLLCPLE